MQSSIESYSQSHWNASVPWLVTAHHRELPYMPAWLVPGSRHSAAATTVTANVSLTGRIFTRGSLRRRLCERQTGGLGVVPRNKCRPRPENDARMRGFRTFLPLALFSFCSNIEARNIPGILTRYSMQRRAVKCLFRLHFRLRPRSQAEPPLWPNCAFCCLSIRDGLKPCMPRFLSALPHLIATCRTAVLPAAHSTRSSRQRKRRFQPLAVLS